MLPLDKELIYLRLQHFFPFFLPVFVNLALFFNDPLLLFPHHMPHSSQDCLILNQNSLLEFEGFLLVFLFKS
uniref:Uncharacterized protein n=1 Tax=Timema tahoe TaxID=61484 RepID=A0A7R9NVW3_9NEOP|nr:unnamed protein product [Timema tahoe]